MSSGGRRVAGNWVVALALAGCAGAQRPATPAASSPSAAPASAPAAPRAATLVEAERAFAESRYSDAEAAFRALLEQGDAGSRASARRGLARSLSQTGRAQEALALLRAEPSSSGD